MYQVLYRKWRPRSFDNVVGQEHITKTLQNELITGRIGHAYLFIGSRGTGKTTCAKILAKAVNCKMPQNGNPCGKCDVCKGIDNGSIMDVVEMDAASNNGVNDIRNLCEESNFTPAVSKYRVYIIDEVHMLSTGAFNALLKTLEEPPEHVIFILATTEAHKIPATILSRCQRFEFHKLSIEDISGRLNFIASKENISLSEDASSVIARLADGAMRDALSLLDKCLSLSNNIDVDEVNKVVGVIDSDCLLRLLQSVVLKDSCSAVKIIDELIQSSKDLLNVCEQFIFSLRNVMLVLVSKESKSLINVSDCDYEGFANVAKETSVDKILKVIDIFEDALQKMTKGCNKQIQLEMAFIKACSDHVTIDLSDLEKRIKKLESGDVIGRRSVDYEKVEIKTTEKSVQRSNDSKVSLEALAKGAKYFSDWPQVLQTLKRYSQTISAAFNGSSAYTNGDYILIDADKDVAFELLRKSSQRDKMRDAIKEVTGKVYKLGPYKKCVSEESEDPLDRFAQEVKDAGIDVTIN